MRTDREELVSLRISVARVAQALAHNRADFDPAPYLKVEGLPFEELHALASTQDRGWNDLCACMVERAESLLDTERRFEALDYPEEFDK